MKITDINAKTYIPYLPSEVKKGEIKKDSPANQDKLEINASNANWQKDILLDALNMIENNIQLDNNNPLDRPENQPIESYEEALIELQFFNTLTFKHQASKAQANLEPKDVLDLFVEDAA